MQEGCCERWYDNMACDCVKTDKTITLSLEQLRKFCLQYDKLYGEYEDASYIGREIYEFIASAIDPYFEGYLFAGSWRQEMKNVY